MLSRGLLTSEAFNKVSQLQKGLTGLAKATDAEASEAEGEALLQAAFSLLTRILWTNGVAVTAPTPSSLPTSLFGHQALAEGSPPPQPTPLQELALAAANDSCSQRCREALKVTVTWPWPSEPPPASAAAPSFLGSAHAAWRSAGHHPQGLIVQVSP